MSFIRIYTDLNSNEYEKAPLYYQFCIYYYSPYVLMNDVQQINPNVIGLVSVN